MRKTSNYKQALILFEELHRKYPTYELGRHIATAFADYGDMWGISGKEFLFALEKYAAELELGMDELVSEEYVNNIIADANSLFLDDIKEEGEED